MSLDAEYKLEEACYFLTLMQESISDTKKFKYHLSAFLTAARSVMDVLRSQLAREPGYKRWKDQKWCELKKNPTSKLLINKREYTVHRRTVEATRETSVSITATVTISSRLSAVLIRGNGTRGTVVSPDAQSATGRTQPSEAKMTHRWFFKEIPEADVLNLCTEYLSLLSDIVSEAKSRFPL